MACAVLAVQGAFIEHEQRLHELDEGCVELRQAADLARPFDRLVLPGGESTVQGKLLEELGMLEGLRALPLAPDSSYLRATLPLTTIAARRVWAR